MIRLGVSLAILAALPAQAQPSFAFHDRHLEQLPSGDTALVLRFLNRDLSALSYADVAPGLDQLCETEGRVQWAELQPTPDELVLVVMDRPIPRGTADPEATQYISAYRIDAQEGCIWQ